MNNLPNDPVMILSFVNMTLRDSYKGLDAMCDDLCADKDEIISKLSGIGYEYDEQENRFK